MTAESTRPRAYAAWLIVASVVGWYAAFALTLEKFQQLADPGAALGCNFSVVLQCGVNLESWQGAIFGFPNPVIGLTAWMAPMVVGVALLGGVRFPRWFWALFAAGMTLALGFVCWLIGQSIFDIRSLCPWCMVTWAVTIPTFFATAVHVVRNGTVPVSAAARRRAGRAMAWVPLATIVAYAVVIAIAQIAGLDLLGEVTRAVF